MNTEEMQNAYGYVPHPGSRVERAQNALEQEIPDVPVIPAEGVSAVEMTAVPVRHDVADTAVYRTVVLNPNSPSQAGSYLQILPQDPQRSRAIVLAIDNDIILCDNKDLAQSPNNFVATPPAPQGFYLSKGVALILEDNGLCFAVNTSSSAATRVSVCIERYFDV